MQEGSAERAGGKIFLCYRREDSAGHAGRVYDRLNRRFPGRVFMDVAGIGVGTRWAEVIEQTLGSCDVVVILIGRRWLERDPAGARRIDDSKDPLRAEITTALRLKRRIIPLLVAGAAVPRQEELPQDLAPLIDWQALTLDDDDFDHDAMRLIEALELQLQDEGTDPQLESADATSSEIQKLLASAESQIARGDWITAAQALKAVLSLDKTNEEATARLKFVKQQSTQAYSSELPPGVLLKGRAGLWKTAAGFGAAAALVILMVLLMTRTEPRPVKPNGEATGQHLTGGQDVTGGQHKHMAGEYELISYAIQGVAMPLSGSMQLVAMSDGHFRFETLVKHATLGEFRYRGRLERQGGANWAQTVDETNDPTAAVKVPIAAELRFDGSRLVLKSLYAQAVWKKRPEA